MLKKIEYPGNRTERITDGAGIITTIQRDEWGNIIRVTDGEGNSSATTYNTAGKPVIITDPLGIVTRFEYDASGNIVKLTKAEGRPEQRIASYVYDPAGQMTGATIGGVSTGITYNAQGLPTVVTEPLGNATRFEYNASGAMTAAIDPLNNRREYSYDTAGNLTTVQDPLGNRITYSYNADNRLTSIKDPMGRITTLESDFRGNTTAITDPLGHRKTFAYDGNGKLTTVTDGSAIIILAYDLQGRLKSITDPEGNTSSYDYTATGCPKCGSSDQLPRKMTDPLGNITENLFDRSGRNIGVKDPLGYVATLVKDARGQVTSLTDANGNITRYQYDALGRVTRQIDAKNNETLFGYDTQGNLTSTTDPNGNTTTFEYDLSGRKTKETRPMGQAIQYGYYANGLLKTVKDAKNQITHYSYDAANRLIEITYQDGTKDTFGYDANGTMTSYAKPDVSGSITYDELGRKLSETVTMGGRAKTFSYCYDAQGNKATLTTPEVRQYNYNYNKNNQVTGITFDNKTITLEYQWQRQTKTSLPNNVVTDYSYNANSWLAAIETKQNSNPLSSSSYQFDNEGNITNKTGDSVISYGYDKTYQLTTAGQESFSYDPAGNRTGTTVNANNELTQTSTAAYTYDANGNTTTKTAGTQTTTYSYDARDRLTQVTLPDGTIASYSYDPFGRRISKTVTGVTTYYLYADEGLIGEYAEDGTPKKTYSWLPDSSWGTAPLTMTQGGSTYYYHNDHLGTPQRLTDDQGNVVWSADYSVFGQATINPASTITSNLRFAGQYFDEETGLHYNWNRYYDSDTGRYIRTDPLGFAAGDTNLYRYVANSPVNAIDPLGLYCDGWQIASNLAAGFGDGISFGLTVKIRQKMGTDHVVNKCSGLYKTAHFAGETVTVTLVGAGIAKTGAWVLSRFAPRLESFFGAATKAERALFAEGEAAGAVERKAVVTGFKEGKTFYRSMSKAEAEAVKDSGMLRGGNPGKTFFTDSRFRSGARAQDRLALSQRPNVQMEFTIKNNPTPVRNGTRVEPVPNAGRGGGREFMTTGPVEVNIINIQPY